MEKGLVDITGIVDKKELVKKLWYNTSHAGSGYLHMTVSEPNEPEIDESIRTGYVDYISGKPIKTWVDRDFVDPSLYDKYAGKGKFQYVVNLLKKQSIKMTMGEEFSVKLEKSLNSAFEELSKGRSQKE